MSRMCLEILLSSFILLRVASEFLATVPSDSFVDAYPFLKKWSTATNRRILTVVVDDHSSDYSLDIPDRIPDDLNVSANLFTLKHLISLRRAHTQRDYQLFETGSCVWVLFSDTDHLRDILVSPLLIPFWHPRNFYILQDRNRRTYDWFDLQRFCRWAFEKLWRFRRLYKLIVLANDKAIRFDPIGYSGYHVRHLFNDSCDWYCFKSNYNSGITIEEQNATDVTDFFEEKRQFKGYPLKVSIFRTTTMQLANGRYSGLDYMFLETITDRMNVTPILTRSSERYGWEENGVFYGTLGHLVYEFADVTFNHVFMKDYSTRQIEFTTAITSDKVCALVPKARPIPDYLVIVKTFSPEAWLLIFLSYFAILTIYTSLKERGYCQVVEAVRGAANERFCWEFVEKTKTACCCLGNRNREMLSTDREKEKRRGERWRVAKGVYSFETMQNVRSTKTKTKRSLHWKRRFLSYLRSLGEHLMQMIMQVMQPYESKRAWFPERLLVICSMLMSLILNGLFTSYFASSLSKRLYYKDIDTLEELEESGLEILTHSRDILDDVLTDVTSPLLQRLNKKLRYANESEVNARLFVTRDVAFLHRLTSVPLKYDEYQRESIHIVKECPKDYIMGNVATKGSPFLDRINSILGRLNNGGFYGKWYRDMFQSQHRSEDGLTEHRKITIRHLLIPYAILLVGLASSVVVFLCERRQNELR